MWEQEYHFFFLYNEADLDVNDQYSFTLNEHTVTATVEDDDGFLSLLHKFNDAMRLLSFNDTELSYDVVSGNATENPYLRVRTRRGDTSETFTPFTASASQTNRDVGDPGLEATIITEYTPPPPPPTLTATTSVDKNPAKAGEDNTMTFIFSNAIEGNVDIDISGSGNCFADFSSTGGTSILDKISDTEFSQPVTTSAEGTFTFFGTATDIYGQTVDFSQDLTTFKCIGDVEDRIQALEDADLINRTMRAEENITAVREDVAAVEGQVVGLSTTVNNFDTALPFAIWQTTDDQTDIENGSTPILFGDGTPTVSGDIEDLGITFGDDGEFTNTSGETRVIDVRYKLLVTEAKGDEHILSWIRHSRFPGTGNLSGEPRFGLFQQANFLQNTSDGSVINRPSFLSGFDTLTLEPDETFSIRIYNAESTGPSYFRIGFGAQITVITLNA